MAAATEATARRTEEQAQVLRAFLVRVIDSRAIGSQGETSGS